MQFELPFFSSRTQTEYYLQLSTRTVPVALVQNRHARRYVLRVRADGTVRVTVPRGGSLAEARKFAERNTDWLERQLRKKPVVPPQPAAWGIGTEILFRGRPTPLEPHAGSPGCVRLGEEVIRGPTLAGGDMRAAVQQHLWRLAAAELPRRVAELATEHHISVRRVVVRNQRSRWGSCSRKGTVSLNWRLIQAPDEVRDYLVLHELAHMKEMNHSGRFWAEVERLCPAYLAAERWLKSHASLMR